MRRTAGRECSKASGRRSGESRAALLAVDVVEDAAFAHAARAALTADTDWTCRMLAAGLHPVRVYWHRFIDEHGFASRARWPFVYIWDNHEFSWKGWQTLLPY